jgi:hypothetical protein
MVAAAATWQNAQVEVSILSAVEPLSTVENNDSFREK